MTGEDEFGNYQTGHVVQIIGNTVNYTISTFPLEFSTQVSDARQFSPGQQVKVYQNGTVMPL